MIGLGVAGWQVIGFFLHLAGALACAGAAIWLARRPGARLPHRAATLVALAATAGWCIASAALGSGHALSSVVEAARNLAWIVVVYRLFAVDGRHHAMAPIRPLVAALGFVIGLQLAVALAGRPDAIGAASGALSREVGAMLHMLAAIGALVLLHNLYVGAAPGTRQLLRWPAGALAALWAYDLNLYTVAYLGGGMSELLALRGLVAGGVGLALVFGGDAAADGRRLSPSRTATFRMLSLAVIGGYLVLMAAIAESLSLFGDGLQRLTQVGVLFAAAMFTVLWLPSRKLRGWWRVTLVKHLFQHRYDYRAEWLRFTRTMGQEGAPGEALPERAVRAMAEVTESPGGLLFLPDDDGTLALAARWRWETITVPTGAIPAVAAAAMERDGHIVDIAQAASDDGMALPQWLTGDGAAWALVPLLHFERLQGVIVLARPAVPRRLDWEDFDLLRVIGQQVASYLSEQAGHEALMEARQFDEFNRRIAFVMHDIKNLASQLALLAHNAERHADKPAFRADMLVTLRNSADKLNALLARLGRYGASGGGARREHVELRELAQRVKARLAGGDMLTVVGSADVAVLADPEALEQALVHLAQNAIEAGEGAGPVYLDISSDGMRGRIEVVDSGSGMPADFVRDGLFKPFVSSKPSGFGIGAFEARELVRAMDGRLDVDSREGIGTRFAISLPLFAAVQLIRSHDGAAGGGEETA